MGAGGLKRLGSLTPALLFAAIVACSFSLTPTSTAAQTATASAVIHNSGHSGIVQTVAFAPSGKWIATGSTDSRIKLWDVATGRLLRTLSGHSQQVTALAISRDGNVLVSLGRDNTAKLWDPATGQVLRTIGGLRSATTDFVAASLALSADAQEIVTASFDAIRRFDVATGAARGQFKKQNPFALWQAAALSPDGRLIAAGHAGYVGAPNLERWKGSQVQLLDAASGKIVRVLGTYSKSGGVNSVAFSPDGRMVAVTGQPTMGDGTVQVWEVSSGRLLHTLAHSGAEEFRVVKEAIFSPDSRTILTVGGTTGAKLWDAASGRLIRNVAFEYSGAAAFSPDGRLIAIGHGSNLTLVEASTFKPLPTHFGIDDASTVSISALDADHWLAIGPQGLTIWDAETWQLLQVLEPQPGSTLGRFQYIGKANGRTLVVTKGGERGQSIELRDASTGMLMRSWGWGPILKPEQPCKSCASDSIGDLAISADGRFVAATAVGEANTIKVWDAASGRLVHRLPVSAVGQLVFSADGRALAVGSYDQKAQSWIKLWDMESGKQIRAFRLPEQEGVGSTGHYPFVFTPDERGIATSYTAWNANTKSYDHRTAAILDAGNGRLLRSLAHERIGNELSVLKFSSDGQLLFVGAGNSPSVTVWETATERFVRTLDDNPGSPNSIDLSPDGRRVVVGNENGTSSVWDTSSGERLAITLQAVSGEWVTITPEGFFTASPRGAELLHVVQGFETTGIDQVYQSLYRPDLVREKLAGDTRGLVRSAAAQLDLVKVLASGNAPVVRIASPAPGTTATAAQIVAEVDVEARGGGIGRVEWRINGVTVGVDSPASQPAAGQSLRLTRNLVLGAGNNLIEVVAYNGANLVASVPGRTAILGPAAAPGGPSAQGRLFVLAVGVDDYADKRFRLNFSVADAKDTANAFALAGKGLYADTAIRVLSDAEVTREKLDKTFTELADQIQPADVFLLYLAGHGKTVDGRYYFIPQNFEVAGDSTDAKINSAVRVLGIAQDSWQRWFSQLPARRSLILLDTCEGGTLAADEMETKRLERSGANDRLAQATGRSIITASAGDAEALEGYRGHGLFTYSMLDALNHGDGDRNGLVEVAELAAYIYARVATLADTVFKFQQAPQVKITLNFPLAKQVKVLPDEAPAVADAKPTHQLAQTAQLAVRPGAGQTVVRNLSSQTPLTVLKSENGWALVAREGEMLGYVAARDLAPIQ